uniref:Uncharacterized protein n=1 Tax=Candidatus Kentrum sp. FW TaxID=2126338 RepID=A0A450T648_9GAMM|nr:MAG: hypothetical protein BECKFW1821A_GA0114235_101720 [Candidatus Kentron sp. FW]VFJ62247.1 MAG: hypothetical protein BECKFW1821B_GA0114236_10721 [Candidatus Kentron sp. FW]
MGDRFRKVGKGSIGTMIIAVIETRLVEINRLHFFLRRPLWCSSKGLVIA